MSKTRLPLGWTTERLNEVAEINPPNPEVPPEDDTLVSFVPMAAVQAMGRGIDTSETRPWRKVRKGYKRFQDGDVLFAKITPCMENGKLAVVNGLLNGVGAGSTEFHVLRPSAALRPDLLAYYMLRDGFRAAARSKMTGTAGQLRVPQGFLEGQTLPVPPPRDQKRIVETINSYFTRLDDVTATLERARRNLKRYRASILKAAVEGRLVPTEADLARTAGRDYEPASVLLERILAERRQRWEERELAGMETAGKTPKSDRWKARYKEPTAPDAATLPPLPEGWCWATVDQLSQLIRNGYPRRPTTAGDVRILRISAVRPMAIDPFDCRWLPGKAEDYATDLAEPGDLLFTRYNGTPSLVGVAALVRAAGQPLVHPDKLIKVRFVSLNLDLAYLELAANTGSSRRFIDGQARTTAGQTGISGHDIKQVPVPLPPSTEQRRISQAVAGCLGTEAVVERIGKTTATQIARLKQCVLRSAFDG